MQNTSLPSRLPIPTEILDRVFINCSLKERLIAMAVCRQFRESAADDYQWKKHFRKTCLEYLDILDGAKAIIIENNVTKEDKAKKLVEYIFSKSKPGKTAPFVLKVIFDYNIFRQLIADQFEHLCRHGNQLCIGGPRFATLLMRELLFSSLQFQNKKIPPDTLETCRKKIYNSDSHTLRRIAGVIKYRFDRLTSTPLLDAFAEVENEMRFDELDFGY